MDDPLAYLDSRRERMTELVTRLANLNSYSHNTAGLAAVADVLRTEFAALSPDSAAVTPLPPARALSAAAEVNETPLGDLLSFTKRPGAPLQALLVIHYDTVYPPDKPSHPITRVNADTLRGPGVADAKGSIVVMLNALLALERSAHAANLGWRVLLNPDEEIGSPGSAPLLAEAARGADFALVFEPAPTPNTLVDQRKGSGNFSAIFRGRSAHAGREIERGRNAVLAAARFALDATAAISAIPGATINVAKIDGGGPANVVPDLAIARFNIRVVTPEQQARVEARLADLIAAANRDDVTATLDGHFSSPPWVMNEPSRRLFDHVLTAGANLGLSLRPQSSGGASDANKIASTGAAVVDSLGPVGGDLHSPAEWLDLRTLVERAKLSALLLTGIASGKLPPPLR